MAGRAGPRTRERVGGPTPEAPRGEWSVPRAPYAVIIDRPAEACWSDRVTGTDFVAGPSYRAATRPGPDRACCERRALGPTRPCVRAPRAGARGFRHEAFFYVDETATPALAAFLRAGSQPTSR